MSDHSIKITERQIVDAMDEMCSESLHPELFYAWEQIVTHLSKVRKDLQSYPMEVIPGTMDALAKLGI